jgi:hypothetical protein
LQAAVPAEGIAMPGQREGEAFRNARAGGADAVASLLVAWCKPVQLFSAVFAGSREEIAAVQPRLWRVVRQRLPGFPDDALPEPWLYHQLAGEMALIIEAAGSSGDELRQRLAAEGARALRQDYLCVRSISAVIARGIAALDARSHDQLSRRYRGRQAPVTRDAALRMLELRSGLDWQAHATRPPGDSDPRFPQLLEDALCGCGDPGAGARLQAALVADARLGAVFERQARLDLVLGAWFAPVGPLECEALIRELAWGGDDSSRISPLLISARRAAAGPALLAPPGAPAAAHAPGANAAAKDRARVAAAAAAARLPRPPSRAGRGMSTAMLIASAAILLGLFGGLLLFLSRHPP